MRIDSDFYTATLAETAEKTIPRLMESYRVYYALFRRAWEEKIVR